MDFEFSAEQVQLRNEARRYLDDHCPPAKVRAVLEKKSSYDRELWKGFAEMGFLAINIPEAFGGLGLGYLELCILAEESGRALAPIPFSSSVYLATEFLLAAGSDAQQQRWLPRLAKGDAIGSFAFAETAGPVTEATIKAQITDGRLSGVKIPVPDGAIADFAIVAAGSGADISLFLVDLDQVDIVREPVETLDPSRSHARIAFTDAAVEPLDPSGAGWALIETIIDKAAILTAFEQIGGAERALEMARDYALERMAFGRQIGSFQAIKHMLADMYVALTLARSNCYFGAWALEAKAPELGEAAAVARVSATQAYQLCAQNNIQVHGGMGFTWAFDCHLFFRRSNLLALSLGGLSQWEDRLIEHITARIGQKGSAT